MDLWKGAALGAAIVMLAACQPNRYAYQGAPASSLGAAYNCRSKLTGDIYTVRGADCSPGDTREGFALADQSPTATPAPAPKPAPVNWKERRITMTPALEKAIKDAARADLKDPDSAQFRAPMMAFKDADGDIAACGFVNAKNSYGGYVGFEPFRAFIGERKNGYFAAGAVFGGGRYPQTFYELHPMCDARNW